MGKIKKPRPDRQNRSVIKNDSDMDEEVPTDSKEYAIQNILDQLQSANVEEKYCALQTFAHLIETSESIPLLLERGVVKSAAPLLLDSASSVRNAAAGALRNLSAVGLDTCDSLMEQDIMTSLTCYFHEHAEKWVPQAKSKSNNEDIETFIQCTNLLWNLCESSDLAIKYLGKSRILDILPRYLDLAGFGNEIVTSVLQCLFVVLEDNPYAMEKVKVTCENYLQQLLSLENDDPSVLLIRTLSAGVIINTCGGNLASLPVDVINKIIAILASTLSKDHRFVCNQLSSTIPLADASGKVTALKEKDAQVLENQLKAVSQMLDAQQFAVEIVTNICSNEDNDDSIETEDSDSEEMGDEETCNTNGNDDSLLPDDKLPPEILEALISLEIFHKVWARTQLPAENVMLILKEYEGSQLISKKLHNLQARALLCINNMLSSLPIDDLGGVDGVYKIWVDAGKLVFNQSAENLTLLESATAVMRAALDKIKSRNNQIADGENLFNDLALADIERMLTGIKECQVPEIRSNLIRMIGILAMLLVNNLNDVKSRVIATVTEFILDQAHKENEVWVLAEAVDTIIDLYSEDETDVIASQVKLVNKLAVLAPILKNKVRQQKRLPKEYKVLVSTAVSNLPRFIKYKKSRVAKL